MAPIKPSIASSHRFRFLHPGFCGSINLQPIMTLIASINTNLWWRFQ